MILSQSVVLTAPQLSVLNKGLTFIPTLGCNRNLRERFRFDIQGYHRRIKLWSYYGDDTHRHTSPLPFMPKSNWTPPNAKLPPHILQLVDQDLHYFNNVFSPRRVTSNLTPEETRALRELVLNHDLVIKPADKGSMVVVLDKEQYLWEGYKQLHNASYYRKLRKPIFLDTLALIVPIFNTLHAKRFITAKQKNYLLGDTEPRPRYFYLLPKVHKDPATWSSPFSIPPGRPIVSDCGSETYRSAEYIDHFLNPLSSKHESYLRDTYDFIHKLKSLCIPEDSLLFTMDVASLYTNIDIQEGIQAVKNLFALHRDIRRPDKELLQLLEINLTRNDFVFDGQYFLQIKGTAMGKRFAPAYADIFMADWETKALEKCVLKPLHYFRYLDDIWGVWDHSEQEFEVFLRTLNDHNPSIQLTATTSRTFVHFLDTTVFKAPPVTLSCQLLTRVYFKDTDTHALLHRASFHPKHTFPGLVKSQLLRFHRISSLPQDFETACRILFAALLARGYTRSLLRNTFRNFLRTKPIQVGTVIPLVTTFSLSALPLVSHLKHQFQTMIKTHRPLDDTRVIAAYRRNKNLRDYLVRARLPSQDAQQVPTYFTQPNWIMNTQSQVVFKLPILGSVLSKNCVYVIVCQVCNIKYVGETGQTIHARFRNHKLNICKGLNLHRHVVAHFRLHGWDAVRASVLESNHSWSTAQRRRAERDWILRLNTIFPTGLNERMAFRP